MKYDCSRRDFLKAVGMGVAAAALPGCDFGGRRGQSDSDRPNIILIMADDMGYSDIGCYGGEIETPNLDRLAAGGLRFTQFYNTARCCPTRASLLTGLYQHQAGMGGMVGKGKAKGPYQGYLNDKCVTIAEVLGPAGYSAGMSGKWHVGEHRPNWPTDRGFEKYFGLISGGANYFDITKAKAKGVKRRMAMDDKPWTPPKEGFYMTDAFSDNAVGFLDEYGRKDKPFFMYVAYTAPHWPLHAWPEDIEKYRGKYMAGWDELRRRRHKRMIEMGLVDAKWKLSPRDAAVKPWDSLDEEKKKEMDLKMAVYAAQIDRMDQGIGRILAKLREVGKEENTLVLFLADNGGCAEGGIWGFDRRENGLPPGGVDSYMSYGQSWANASNTPFRRYKHWVHEGGVATPLIAYWPAVVRQKGELTDQPGHLIDIMATCCDIAGAPYPRAYKGRKITPLEGKSLLPILKGGKRNGHEAIYFEHEGNRAIRRGDWKLVSVRRGKWELYNLKEDRTETNNLAEKYPEKAGELLEMFNAWAARCGVKNPR
ncbi:MAG: arylsulfatase [Planctomycetota bacterium]|nr:MAG: arylsulfatase [Planctomycetota bacterium]